MHVLVVGATGALRPAAETLLAGGHRVTALARTVDVAGAEPIEVDFNDLPTLAAALDGRRFDAALLYCPTAPGDVVALFEQVTTGRVVHLLTSASVTPPVEPADLTSQRAVHVVLGWTDGRWHTPAEISTAALTALRTGADAVLGVVRPWADRPA